MNLLKNLRDGLMHSRKVLGENIGKAIPRRRLDAASFVALEEMLITADIGVRAAQEIVAALRARKIDRDISEGELKSLLVDEITVRLAPMAHPFVFSDARPFVILVSGMNGAGKTTTIGKLAAWARAQEKSVLLVAGDTYRVAAREQLAIWGERADVTIFTDDNVKDPAALAYVALARAEAENIDVVLIDTAGRLHANSNLMDQLAKIVRVIEKQLSRPPDASLLVLDATTGQNAIAQAEGFLETAKISGLIMTKLDGTARGGVLLAIAQKLKLPIHFIGVGETLADLLEFDASAFAHALIGSDAP